MHSKLIQIQKRVSDLETLADDVARLAERFHRGEQVQPELGRQGQAWYRGSRELLVQHSSSSLKEFDNCYEYYPGQFREPRIRASGDIEQYISLAEPQQADADQYRLFELCFRKARSFVPALTEELLSRELPVVTELSFALSADEFEKAEYLLSEGGQDEVIIRASGVVARVALERHLFTVVESHHIRIIVNPPNKKRPGVEDVLNTLRKEGIIKAVQFSHFESLFSVANNCAHSREVVKSVDVQRLIREGRALAANVL